MSLVETEIRGPVAILTLNRPQSMNALGEEGDGAAMEAALREVSANRAVRCAILTGAGKAFSAGGDLKAMQARTGAFAGGPADVREGYRGNIHRLVRALYSFDLPLIAAVNGPAIGLGCDVATLCDIRIAAAGAKFGVTFLKIGLIPGDGGAWILPRAIGASRAAELLFTGDVIDAETACAWGSSRVWSRPSGCWRRPWRSRRRSPPSRRMRCGSPNPCCGRGKAPPMTKSWSSPPPPRGSCTTRAITRKVWPPCWRNARRRFGGSRIVST